MADNLTPNNLIANNGMLTCNNLTPNNLTPNNLIANNGMLTCNKAITAQ